MSYLVKDLKGWIKKGKGKMSVDEVNENPTYFKIMVSRIETGDLKYNCEVYSEIDKDRVSENYIANKNTPPEQVLEIMQQLLGKIPLEKPVKTEYVVPGEKMSNLVKNLEGWIKKGEGKILVNKINENPTSFNMKVSWVKKGKPKFHCQICNNEDEFGKNYIANENTPPEQVLEIMQQLLGKIPLEKPVKTEYVVPDNLKELIQNIRKLKTDPKHQERAHESLVEDFFCALGYEKHRHIKYRIGRIDISIWKKEKPVLIAEVKKDWNLSSYNYQDAVKQAYIYAQEKGAQYVVVTNGDYYALFDRSKGLSYESNKEGEFKLTALEEKHLNIINKLKLENLLNSYLE